MKTYNVQIARTEYLSQTIQVQAESAEIAQEIAWDKSGDWECVEAEEFTNQIEEVTE